MRGFWIIAVFSLFAPAGALAQGDAAAPAPLAPEAFTEAYAEAVRTLDPTMTAEAAGPLEVRLTPSDPERDGTATAYLDNAYRAYLDAPERLDGVIAAYAASALERRAPPTPADRARITPVIKDALWLREAQASLADMATSKEPPAFAHEPLNETLQIVYALDSAESVAFLQTRDLSALEIAPEALRETATANLRGLLKEIQIKRHGAIFVLKAGGDYDASLLLLDDIWAKGGPLQIDGEIVVAVPARDLLMATDAGNLEAVAQMRSIAAEVATQSPYAVSSELFIRRKGAVEVYRP